MRELPFNDYVAITQTTVTRDDIGGVVNSWGTLRSIWCRVEDVTAREYLANTEPQAERITKVRCYWDDVSDVTAAMQITHGARTLLIEGVLRSAQGGRAILMCRELTT